MECHRTSLLSNSTYLFFGFILLTDSFKRLCHILINGVSASSNYKMPEKSSISIAVTAPKFVPSLTKWEGNVCASSYKVRDVTGKCLCLPLQSKGCHGEMSVLLRTTFSCIWVSICKYFSSVESAWKWCVLHPDQDIYEVLCFSMSCLPVSISWIQSILKAWEIIEEA